MWIQNRIAPTCTLTIPGELNDTKPNHLSKDLACFIIEPFFFCWIAAAFQSLKPSTLSDILNGVILFNCLSEQAYPSSVVLQVWWIDTHPDQSIRSKI